MPQMRARLFLRRGRTRRAIAARSPRHTAPGELTRPLGHPWRIKMRELVAAKCKQHSIRVNCDVFYMSHMNLGEDRRPRHLRPRRMTLAACSALDNGL